MFPSRVAACVPVQVYARSALVHVRFLSMARVWSIRRQTQYPKPLRADCLILEAVVSGQNFLLCRRGGGDSQC